MSRNNTNIKREFLNDNGYDDDDVDTIEADDQMDYEEEEEILMEGNIITGALTIYPAEFNRQQQLRQKTLVTPKNNPKIAIIERNTRLPTLQPGQLKNPNLTAIPTTQLFPPQNRTPPTPAIYKGSIAVAPKNNIKVNIDNLPLLQTYPIAFNTSTFQGFNFGDIVARKIKKQQQQENDIAFVPGLSGWITRGLNQFEMIVLTNDIISTISTITIRFENNSHLDLSKVKFFLNEIYINYDNEKTSGFAYTYNGRTSTATFKHQQLLYITRRIADRLVKIHSNSQIENIVDIFGMIPFTTSKGQPKVIKVNKFRMIFTNDQNGFILYYNAVLQLEDGSQRNGNLSFDLTDVLSTAIIISSLIKILFLNTRSKILAKK